MQPDEMQVYIVNLGKYNEGEMVGAWFHFPLDFDEIKERIGLNNEYEEYAIHDYEMPFKIDQYTSIDQLNNLYESIESLADSPVYPAMDELINNWFTNIDDLIEHAEEITHYDEGSMEDLASYLVEEGLIFGELPDKVQLYIDYVSLGRDLEIEGNYLVTSNGIYEYSG